MEEAPPIVHEVLRSPGQPLDPVTRAHMEPRFGHDFSRTRVHADRRAAESARAVDALAYTVGQDIAFAAGQYSDSPGGRKLLAHELAHVVQQSRGGMAPGIDPDAAYERSAEAAATSVASGGRVDGVGATGIGLARAPAPPVHPKVLQREAIVDQMQSELAADRAGAPAASSKAEESRRTFAVAKVLDESGAVVHSVRRSFMARPDLHAEEAILAEIRGNQLVRPGYTLLLMVDQYPCPHGPNCDLRLKEHADDPSNGSLRVYTRTRFKKDFKGQVTPDRASPKTAVTTKDDPTNPKFHLELTDYRRVRLPLLRPAPAPGGKTSAPTPVPPPAGTKPVPVAPKAAAPSLPPVVPEQIAPAKPSAKPPESSKTPGKPGSAQPATGAKTAPKLGAAVAVGGVAAIQAINTVLVQIGDEVQRKAARTAYYEQLGLATRALQDAPGSGAIIFLYFEQPPTHPDSAISPGSRFVDAAWNYANHPNDLSVEMRPYLPGKTIRREHFWVPPVSAKKEKPKGESQPKAPPVPVQNLGDFVAKTLHASTNKSTLQYSLTLHEALQGATLSLGGQLVVVEGVALHIGHDLYGQLSSNFREMVQNEARKKLKGIQDAIAHDQARLEKFLQEGGVTKWWEGRRVDLNPHMFDGPRAHAASAAIAIDQGRFRDALSSLRGGSAEHTVGWKQLFLYENGFEYEQ
jgi:hypothetical protein